MTEAQCECVEEEGKKDSEMEGVKLHECVFKDIP